MYGDKGVSDVIFDSFNPTGSVPQIWNLRDFINKLDMADMMMRPNETNNSYPGKNKQNLNAIDKRYNIHTQQVLYYYI